MLMRRNRLMLQKDFIIQNKVGLHARPAAILAQTASKFKSNIFVEKDGKKVLAKSVLGVLSLGVEIEGEDKEEAMKALGELITNRFGDEE
jgi:phosphocarrier protein HPr